MEQYNLFLCFLVVATTTGLVGYSLWRKFGGSGDSLQHDSRAQYTNHATYAEMTLNGRKPTFDTTMNAMHHERRVRDWPRVPLKNN